MRRSRARSAATGPFVAVVAAALGIACASARPFAAGDELGSNEGLLVLHVRTERPLRSISISNALVPLQVDEGETHLSLIAVAAGRHRWSALGLAGNAGDDRAPEIVQMLFRNVPELRFTIVPGSINYAGMLEVYDHGWFVSMRSVDRAAFSLEQLRSRFAASVEQHPITYSGTARHVFLERYLTARSVRREVTEPAPGVQE